MLAILCLSSALAAEGSASVAPVDVAQAQLERAMTTLRDQPSPPHYAAIAIEDREAFRLRARDGVVETPQQTRSRFLDVEVRTGSPELDSTHALRGFSSLDGSDREVLRIPLNDGFALEHAIWREIDRRYREARERIVMVRANLNVKADEERPADDFEPRKGLVDEIEVPQLNLDEAMWHQRLDDIAAMLHADSNVHRSTVQLDATRRVTSLVDTERARLVHGRRHLRLSIAVGTRADDGDDIGVYRAVDVHDPDDLPDAKAVLAMAEDALGELAVRRSAPRAEPYSGPVLLSGRAAAVFIHEVLGHRVEGHRQKSDDEGRTFAEHVGRRVLPNFIDIYDDPTIEDWEGTPLNGFYVYDDEGVKAQRAEIVDDGVFVGFLMSRSPIPNFDHSNGHGRRSSGRAPTARMGNTILEARRSISDAALRRRLIEFVRRQGLEYGYIVDEIDGGFTLTGRVMPNAFNVRASRTRRVFADGRPDEVVRGIDLVGTPFVAFSNLAAAGRTTEVFNGTCGAESGWVPVSAVAPSLLFERLEFQLKEKGQERPPLLSKPNVDDGAAMMEAP
ncbi:MAG: metallopeptidase TldD-related protein [Myxococcota bacterium]